MLVLILDDIRVLVVWQIAIVLCDLCCLLIESILERQFGFVLALTSDLGVASLLNHVHLLINLWVSILKIHFKLKNNVKIKMKI